MTGVVKRGVRVAAERVGLFGVTRRLTKSLPRILAYHAFCGPKERGDHATKVYALRQQLAHIRKQYRVIPLAELGRALAEDRPLPPRTVALTVDDGYANFARWALPLLREFEIPATLFVITDLVERGDWLWYDEFQYVCCHATSVGELRPEQCQATAATLKRLPPSERDSEVKRFADAAGVAIPKTPPAEAALLTWNELRDVAADGLVEIGAHTRTHPILSTLSDEAAAAEIRGSRDLIRARLGVESVTFCYPNGLAGDYGETNTRQVAAAGYVCATASHCGLVTPQANRFALPRLGATNDFNLFRKLLDGFEHLQRRLWSGD